MNQPPQPSKPMGPFLTIWIGQVFSLLGSELVQFALIWYLTRETGSATVLATATLLQLLPAVFLGPFVGPLIDRWNRRLTMIAADAAVAVATGVLALLFLLGLDVPVLVAAIYVIMLIRAVGQTVHRPAMQATTPLMVPEEHLTRVAGLNQMLNGGLSIIAAPLGALLMELLPMQAILGIDLVTAMIAISPLLFVAVPQPPRSAESVAASTVLGDMAAGFRYVWSWTGLMIVLAMAALINMLATPAFTLLPLLVSEFFDKGVIQLGWMQFGFGAGVIAGGIALSTWGGFKRRIYTAMVGLIGMGITTGVIGFLSPDAFTAALAMMALCGVAMPLTNGAFGAIVQATAAPEMQGRLWTLIMSLATGLSLLGLAVAGPLADALGIQMWFVVSGVATTLMGVGIVSIRSVRNLEEDAKRARSEAATLEIGTPLPEPASAD